MASENPKPENKIIEINATETQFKQMDTQMIRTVISGVEFGYKMYEQGKTLEEAIEIVQNIWNEI